MEMEGRGLSELFRNTSEEIFLKAVMENSMGVAAPSMEMLGFRNKSQSFREDSEELFNSWLMNGEIPGFNSMTNRPRQPSRLSSEIVGLPDQQHDAAQQKHHNDNLIPQNTGVPTEYLNNLSQHSLRNAAEKGMQASDLLLAKAWFHSSQPMTRSRSSELRRRYAAMQSNLTPMVAGTTDSPQPQGTNLTKQEFTNTRCSETPNQTPTFISPSHSSTSPLDTPPMLTQDAVTSVVSMLKDTLERKRLSSHAHKDHDTSPANSFGFYTVQQIQQTRSCNQDQVSNILGATEIFPLVTTAQVQDCLMLPKVERPLELHTESFVTPPNQVWLGAMSREPSQSGSSTAITALSAGFEVGDDPPLLGQAMSVCESTRINTANGTTDCGSKCEEYRERILKDNLKDDRKKGTLARMGSISSEHTVDKGDPTKKRRVERSRKMAEAKERNLTPVIPSDMQAVLKRCENLEKEVRSLKLNLSFMNRKDSDQTKQIEELQKQNEDLTDEKERLLEEIERILFDTSSR